MSDPLAPIAADAKAELVHAEALLAPAVTNFKTLLSNRLDDAFIAVLAVGFILLGHAI